MKPALVCSSLYLLAFLAGCGEATAPDDASEASRAEAGVPDMSNPVDVLATLAPQDQPVGLDVYTAKCVSCHGDLGQGVPPSPPLRGLSPSAMQRNCWTTAPAKPWASRPS